MYCTVQFNDEDEYITNISPVNEGCVRWNDSFAMYALFTTLTNCIVKYPLPTRIQNSSFPCTKRIFFTKTEGKVQLNSTWICLNLRTLLPTGSCSKPLPTKTIHHEEVKVHPLHLVLIVHSLSIYWIPMQNHRGD
jgi:hypothetical protein